MFDQFHQAAPEYHMYSELYKPLQTLSFRELLMQAEVLLGKVHGSM